MLPHQREGVSMGETAVAVKANEKLDLGGTKAQKQLKEIPVLKSIRRFRRGMGRDDSDDA
eukprot:434001-Prorocentrum_lima.AAC.1